MFDKTRGSDKTETYGGTLLLDLDSSWLAFCTIVRFIFEHMNRNGETLTLN